MSEFNNPQFSKFMQVGIIVRDVEKAVKIYEEVFGMGPWEMGKMDGTAAPTTDLAINGEAAPFVVAKTAFLYRYGMEFELIEPVGDTPYKAWLDEHGPGIHHIAVTTRDEYDKVLTDYKELTGKDIWCRGTGIGGLMDFSYLDLREELGLFVECYRNIKPGRLAIDY